MTEDAVLRQQAVKGQLLSELRNHGGWEELVTLLQELYNEAWDELKAKENPVARAKIMALEELMQKMDDKVNLGNHARTDLQTLAATSTAAP